MQEEAWVLDLGCLSRHHAAQVQRYRRLALLMQPQGLISFKLFGFDFWGLCEVWLNFIFRPDFLITHFTQIDIIDENRCRFLVL